MAQARARLDELLREYDYARRTEGRHVRGMGEAYAGTRTPRQQEALDIAGLMDSESARRRAIESENAAAIRDAMISRHDNMAKILADIQKNATTVDGQKFAQKMGAWNELNKLISVDAPAELYDQLGVLRSAGLGSPGVGVQQMLGTLKEAIGKMSENPDDQKYVSVLMQKAAASFSPPLSYGELKGELLESAPGDDQLRRQIDFGEDAGAQQDRNLVGMIMEADDLKEEIDRTSGTAGVRSFHRIMEDIGVPFGEGVSAEDITEMQEELAPGMVVGDPDSETLKELRSQLGVTTARDYHELHLEILQDPEFEEMYSKYAHAYRSPSRFLDDLMKGKPLPEPREELPATAPVGEIDEGEALNIDELMAQLKAEEPPGAGVDEPVQGLKDQLKAMISGEQPTPEEAQQIAMFLRGEAAEKGRPGMYNSIIYRMWSKMDDPLKRDLRRALPGGMPVDSRQADNARGLIEAALSGAQGEGDPLRVKYLQGVLDSFNKKTKSVKAMEPTIRRPAPSRQVWKQYDPQEGLAELRTGAARAALAAEAKKGKEKVLEKARAATRRAQATPFGSWGE